MDVNLPFTRQIMQRFNAVLLIHGHTHREAIHQYDDKKRIVLGDWRPNYASILTATENGEIYFLKSP